LSRVFDARKHAERANSAREAGAAAGGVGEAGAVAQSPEADPQGLAPSTVTTTAKPAHLAARTGEIDGPPQRDVERAVQRSVQRGPIVRSLLRAGRSSARPAIAGAPGTFRERPSDEPATLIFPQDPIYPESAREQLISGSVEVHFRISAEGKVYDVKSVRGAPVLARAAIEAVESRRYEPARLDGAPIDSQARTSFDFRLD
jgi:TonB family protein